MATIVAFRNATFLAAESTRLDIADFTESSSSARVTDPRRASTANRATLCTLCMDATDTTLFAINKDDTCPATLLPEVDADCICARRAVPAAAAATVVTELLMTPAIAATHFPKIFRHRIDTKPTANALKF